MTLDRRAFLRWSAATSAAAALGARASARPQGGSNYRALVCVFLYGGADTLNLLVPTSTTEYGEYSSSRGNLAESPSSLLGINPVGATGGVSWGLHNRTPELRDLFEAGKLSFLLNVGPLVRPLSKAEYTAGVLPRPAFLFSHIDQQREWLLAHALGNQKDGWGGRVLEALPNAGGTSGVPAGVNLENKSLFLKNGAASPYTFGRDGLIPLGLASDPERRAALEAVTRAEHPLARELGAVRRRSLEIEDALATVLPSAPNFGGFPGSTLGQDLKQIARLISVRGQLGVERQVYFVGVRDFDTHSGQAGRLPVLFDDLSASLGAFQAAIDQLGEGPNVTGFVSSEFGRTLSSNGTGTDHGWGGHAFVFGGGLQGRRLFGTRPSLALDGPDDVGRGRLLPTTGVDQVAATLAKWLGVPPAQLPSLFPNLPNFPVSDLGFMG